MVLVVLTSAIVVINICVVTAYIYLLIEILRDEWERIYAILFTGVTLASLASLAISILGFIGSIDCMIGG